MGIRLKRDLQVKAETYLCELADNKDETFRQLNEFLVESKQEQQDQSYRFLQLAKNNKTAEQFWALDGGQWPQLQTLAQQIFSLIATSAASERSFSAMGFIHSKLRNRLSHNTLDKLVFVRSNRLLTRSNEDVESSESDEEEEEQDQDVDI